MLSFILPARNHASLTAQCLISVDFTVKSLGLPAEFILIDDDSNPDDGIQQVFADFQKKQPAARILRLARNHHYTGVFALGLQHAKYQSVIFVSNDMMITPSFVSTLLAVGALNDSYGIVRGTSAHTDSHPEHTVTPPVPLCGYDGILRFSEMIAAVNGLHHVQDGVLSGDAVLIKRRLIDTIGVMDTRFFGYFGDIDYGLRAHLAGFKLVCAKGAWLHHDGAGHLKGEAEAGRSEGITAPYVKRMALVQKAYEAFRNKWDSSLPERYNDLKSLHLFEMAERNAHKIQIKCQIDPALINDVKYLTAFSS